MSSTALSPIDKTAPWYVGTNGATNFTRHQAQSFAREIVESEAYRISVTRRAASGGLSPAIESMLWHYAYGKPIEQIAMTIRPGEEDLSSLSMDELLTRAKMIAHQLEEARELAEALPADVLKGPWA